MYIRWIDLVAVVAGTLFSIVCFYLIKFLKNLNDSTKVVKVLVTENRDNIDKVLKELPLISVNLAEISGTVNDQVKVVGLAINSINDAVEATAAAAQTIRDDVVGRFKSILELIELIRAVFFKDSDKSREKSVEKQGE